MAAQVQVLAESKGYQLTQSIGARQIVTGLAELNRREQDVLVTSMCIGKLPRRHYPLPVADLRFLSGLGMAASSVIIGERRQT